MLQNATFPYSGTQTLITTGKEREMYRTHHDAIKTVFQAFMAAGVAAQAKGYLYPRNVEFLIKHVNENYDQPWRHFHDIRHIADGCERILGLWGQLHDPVSVMTAWLFHDVVYVAGAIGENEKCSAKYLEALHEEIDSRVIRRATPIIHATVSHLLPENYCGNLNDLAVVLDIDLAGMAGTRDRFIADGENIRAENGQTHEEWVTGRARFAEMLLGRPKIFHTEHFADSEAAIRANLTWAVDEAERLHVAA